MHKKECIDTVIAHYKMYPYPNYHIAQFLIWLKQFSKIED